MPSCCSQCKDRPSCWAATRTRNTCRCCKPPWPSLQTNALLSRGLEGEVCADPRRSPQYDGFVAGQHQLLQARSSGTDSQVPGLPSERDADTTARYTEAVLAGQLPVPAALAQQVEHVLAIAQQTQPGSPSLPP